VRVLVVDDESSVRFVLRKILEAAGHEVLEASDGAAALACVANCRPQLVMTDVKMPVMSGQELVARLRSDPATASIPIIVVSSEPDIIALPVDAALAKPFRNHELLESVRALHEVTG
jgi:two-component system, chemotaxis family, chemotaxis protein CheY